jgi:CRP-like cAMP-binding protein
MLVALMLQMQNHVFLPGDFIVTEGEDGHEMFLILRGEVEVVKDGVEGVIGYMGQGEFFGEIALVNDDTRRTASVRAVTSVELSVLEREAVREIVMQYPAYGDIIRNLARRHDDAQDVAKELKQIEEASGSAYSSIVKLKGLQSGTTSIKIESVSDTEKEEAEDSSSGGMLGAVEIDPALMDSKRGHLSANSSPSGTILPLKRFSVLNPGPNSARRRSFQPVVVDQPQQQMLQLLEKMNTRLEALEAKLDNLSTGSNIDKGSSVY